MQKTADVKTKEWIERTGMLKGARRIIAGVSGGADSVFLFYQLKEVCQKEGLPFEVIHVHHGIRGAEADGDAEMVRDLCERFGVKVRVIRRDIPLEARRERLTLEEAGRAVRYAIFREAAGEVPGTKVALAHQKNDVAETLLFNLARGTGLKGMGSIRPCRDLFIRPLLAVTREELVSWLKSHDISWREDSTNLDDDAVRNRIRHHVLPYLAHEVNARTVSHLAEAAEIAGRAADFIEAEAKRRSELYLTEETLPSGRTMIRIDAGLVRKEPRIMQEEVVRLAIRKTLATLKDVSSLHVRLILELFDREGGKFLNLPKGLTAEKKRGEVWLTCCDQPKKGTRKQANMLE